MLALVTVAVSSWYVYWLGFGGQSIEKRIVDFGNIVVVMTTIMIAVETLRLTLVSSLALGIMTTVKPVPMTPPPMKVALFITFVPTSEDIAVLERTLRAAIKIKLGNDRLTRERSLLHIYVLNEGDPNDMGAVWHLIETINQEKRGHKIIHFSRYGVERWNTARGTFAARTKYGNINALLDCIRWLRKSDGVPLYDVVMGIDPDHVPTKDFALRMLGYFRDKDVAYVVGPQAYANATHNIVAKLAESQQFVFHTILQLAANRWGVPMLVGTSYAIRLKVLRTIGGVQPSITEDMSTTFPMVTRKTPLGKRWRGVYTPDVLAHGEGPGGWGDFFKQQNRWSRGAIDYAIFGPFILQVFRMWRHPMRIIHYIFMMAFYPVMALSWIFGAISMLLFALYGASGSSITPNSWALLYGWTAILQMAIYLRMRRHNVSPYEKKHSWGMLGMFMSVMAAPVYANAFIMSMLRRPCGFETTPKGAKSTGDSWYVFRHNIMWFLFYVTVIGIMFYNNFAVAATLAWPLVAAATSIAPVVIWRFTPAQKTIESMSVPNTKGGVSTKVLVA